MNIPLSQTRVRESTLPPLDTGDHLDQKTFHARYEAMPEHVGAELIGGIVYMASPLKAAHGKSHPRLIIWLGRYQACTPGTEVYDNTTIILGEESEPQPDCSLVILPECGGQAFEDDEGYLTGAPEWVGEVGQTSASIDLHAKLRDYEQAGVREYLVVVLREERAIWFIRGKRGFKELPPDPDGIIRSRVFPGLWLDPMALLRRDSLRMDAVLQQGLATSEHQMFVKKLKKS